ncbi:hypothetical protein ACN27F_23050 [Solwaraspora sp. WMMB335]|uniref:hypothetical protein n=1 Tax=Solwaraspora sp. WMMB335 TaxID=3404118 RepID=UPI003B94502E
MSVRRTAARLTMVLVLTGGAAAFAASPAYAQDERVQISLPGRFNAGETAGGITVKVTKRTDGCVAVRTSLAIRLPGATPDLVAVQARIDDDWVSVPIWADGGGLLLTDRTAPEKDELCKGKSRSVRYRMAFLAGAPAGTANIVGEAYTAGGELLGRAAGAKKVTGRLAGTYQPGPPTPSPSEEPTPEPAAATPQPSEAPALAAPDQDLLAAAGTGGGPGSDDGSGIGTGVMAAGIGMVAIGVALLVLLIRRGRPSRLGRSGSPGQPGSGGGNGSGGDGGATMLLPRIRR